jgi:hypothetical protein
MTTFTGSIEFCECRLAFIIINTRLFQTKYEGSKSMDFFHGLMCKRKRGMFL